jgi:hypothetical protein
MAGPPHEVSPAEHIEFAPLPARVRFRLARPEGARAETHGFWVSIARLTALARSTALPLPQ